VLEALTISENFPEKVAIDSIDDLKTIKAYLTEIKKVLQ